MLCADDFAISAQTSRVIAELAHMRCVNAISCMAATPGWDTDAHLLEGVENVVCGHLGPVQVGLHITLSSEKITSQLSYADHHGKLAGPDRLLALIVLGKVSRSEIEIEVDRQFMTFMARRGKAPDFVDAHQHIHAYPMIRDVIIDAVRRRAPQAWVRVPSDGFSAMLRRPFANKAIGSAIQALGLRRKLARAGLAGNSSFAGHYDFETGFDQLLPQFFSAGRPGHLVMCHPGSDDLADDAIASARVREAEVIGAMPLDVRIKRITDRARSSRKVRA